MYQYPVPGCVPSCYFAILVSHLFFLKVTFYMWLKLSTNCSMILFPAVLDLLLMAFTYILIHFLHMYVIVNSIEYLFYVSIVYRNMSYFTSTSATLFSLNTVFEIYTHIQIQTYISGLLILLLYRVPLHDCNKICLFLLFIFSFTLLQTGLQWLFLKMSFLCTWVWISLEYIYPGEESLDESTHFLNL